MTEREFCGMVEQYERLVYTVCWQLVKNHHTAQDLAQDTFIAAYTHRESCPEENPKAWLCRIATNKAKDYLKSAWNRRVDRHAEAAEAQGAPMCAEPAQPQQAVEDSETLHAVANGILALKEPYQQVAGMYYMQDRSVQDIAHCLGRQAKTVQTQLYRARRQLQGRLAGLCAAG